MKYGLIGYPLKHSFSKEIHKKLGNNHYELNELNPDNFDSFMKHKNFLGINVTIPYKEKVIPYLDFIDPRAKAINAVNTIVNENGKLYGFNTDYYGLLAIIKKNNIEIENKNILILGTGGTSKTATQVCLDLKGKVFKASTKPNFDYQYDNLDKAYDEINVIINTTPNGMYPHSFDDELVDLSCFKHLEAVIDVIFNPLQTKLIIKAKELGLKTATGLYMLVTQAVYANSKFFNETINEQEINERIDKIYNEIKQSKQSIVLIGMPSCGKSSLARLLSSKLNREYFDSDKEIEKIIGMKIACFLNKDNEQEFREIENKVIKELSLKTNAIIATGGGVILNKENIDNLKQNGKIYFINRSLKYLKPTKSRPLSSDIAALKEKYDFRLPLYIKYCDKIIDGDNEFDQKIIEIVDDFTNNY
ncbi:MAG: shikimate dehydrogenase [Bacilli bacterium]|nr:shikimate dehydrogenase [Bacilli bacterium]